VRPAVRLRRGLDVGDVPPTPTDRGARAALGRTELMLLREAGARGFPMAFSREQGGALVQNIYPVRESEARQISSSSRAQLGLHTEAAFHEHRPSEVLLLCLRGDPAAATTYAEADEIAAALGDGALAALSQRRFVTSVDESFMSNGEPDSQTTCSVMTRRGGAWTIRYDEALMRGADPEAEEALGELGEAIRAATRSVTLEQGDLLVIDNARAVHGRSPFSARYDGTDRWLQRALSSDRLPPEGSAIVCAIVHDGDG